MIIKVDDMGKKAVDALCDAALKAGGLSNLEFVLGVLKSIEVLPVLLDEIEK